MKSVVGFAFKVVILVINVAFIITVTISAPLMEAFVFFSGACWAIALIYMVFSLKDSWKKIKSKMCGSSEQSETSHTKRKPTEEPHAK